MGSNEEAVAVSVLLEMKQTDRSSFNSNTSAFLDPKQIEETPCTVKTTGCSPQVDAPLLEREQQIYSGKRSRPKYCRAGSKNLIVGKKPRRSFDHTKHIDSKLCSGAPLISPISVISNVPAISAAPNLSMPCLPLNSALPCTFDALVKPPLVAPNPNLSTEKSNVTILPQSDTSNSFPYAPAADFSVQLLQQLFSLVNLLSPQELASALLVAELEKMKAQMMAQQQAELGNFLAFLPILIPLLQQQFQTSGKAVSPIPTPKFDGKNNAAMTWISSFLQQSCSNTLS